MVAFKAAKSFQIMEATGVDAVIQNQHSLDLLAPAFPVSGGDTESISGASVAGSSGATSCLTLLRVCLGSEDLTETNMASTADKIARTFMTSGLSGIALQCTELEAADRLDHLLETLYPRGIPVVVLAHHDASVWTHIDICFVSGIIVENACILPNGERRDYFRARPLRDLMARCAKEREDRPELFVGFLELWENRPHPSIIRRGVKLAEHFGSIIEHGPVHSGIVLSAPVRSAAKTISGFELLRRSAIIELQKYWSTETRKVWVFSPSKSTPAEVSSLPVGSLENTIPNIGRFLERRNLPATLEDVRNQHVTYLSKPEYVDLAPPRSDFWEQSSQGHKLSPKGCYPITSEPTAAQFDAVVDTQKHLEDLQMLQPLKGAEIHRLVTVLQSLVDGSGVHELVHSLIEGLETRQILVWKGLDTGFGVADGIAHFWGVSRARDDTDDGPVDIFISLKAPNDATTILHTWLAHHGLPRATRFELEQQLEIANGVHDHASSLPASIKTAIEQSSHAETLSLLQQMRISDLQHVLRKPIASFCRKTLIEDASRYSWYQQVSKSLLDGSMDMRELLYQRLEHFVRHGASSLPTLDNLIKLHEATSVIIEDALFYGDRQPLNAIENALLEAWDAETGAECDYVDINADLFALIFFSVLRRAGFEDVYIEATDRCPYFLSQPDQAAVFSELWVLGSQCEIYFGILPRGLGEIVYNRYRSFLQQNPPGPDARKGVEIMTMYSNAEPGEDLPDGADGGPNRSRDLSLTGHEKVELWKKRFTELGAMSIFCLPAIMDVLLLSFVGRGVFMTAFMDPEHLQAAGLALLIALLLTAGVTGFVGSVGNYYLVNHAYDNMIYFHIQRLSGGFVLTLIVAACGFVGFSVQNSVPVGLVFAAYVILISTYFNVLGIMSTMHQRKSPMTSGRTVLWRTIPLLLVSPLLSSFVNGYDLQIYLPVTYFFLFLALYQYRRLCHEWSGWMKNLPQIAEKDVLEWYKSRRLSTDTHEGETEGEPEKEKNQDKNAQEALRQAVSSYQRGIRPAQRDKFSADIAEGMPYVDWLFKKTCPNGKTPDAFTSSWFTQLGESRKQQQQLSQGLKEHNILMLFRFARYDLGQNLGLFLVALMDRWVSITMGARLPRPSIYIDSRARYGICLCILYFCASVMLLDSTLQGYWEVQFKLSEEKLKNHEHARRVAKQWEARRLRTLGRALRELLSKILVVFGGCTLLLWLLVENYESMILYYCYVLGYTCVIIFQFNRCFTTNVRAHITIILSSAAIGFVVGCALRAIPHTANWLYSEILAQNLAAVLAALGTLLFAWKDWSSPEQKEEQGLLAAHDSPVYVQARLSTETSTSVAIPPAKAKAFKGTVVVAEDGSFVAREILKHLRNSLATPNKISKDAAWSGRLLLAASTMWADHLITVTVVTRQHFVLNGLKDVTSFSQMKNGVLEVTVGFLGDAELHRPSWQPLLAQLTTEAILYHVARAELKLSHAKAVRSEHFLEATQTLSRRLDFELAFESDADLARIGRRTNIELMKHLCLDLAVDSEWENTPECARLAIMNRIKGKKAEASRDFLAWVDSNDVDISTSDFHVELCLTIHQKISEKHQAVMMFSKEDSACQPSPLRPVEIDRARPVRSLLQHWLRLPTKIPVAFVKWVAIISGAGSDIERELWYCLKHLYFHKTILAFLLFLWKMCWHAKNLWLYVLLIVHRPALANITRLAQKGARRKIKGNSIIVELPRKVLTGFASSDDAAAMVVDVFEGSHRLAPQKGKAIYKAIYDEQLRLKARVDNGTLATTYNYANDHSRWPLSKEVNENLFRTVGFYDKYGRICRGTMTINEKEYAFQYHYKATPKGNSDVLSADFKLINSDSEDMLSVFWGTSLLEDVTNYDWVPSDRVCRMVKVSEGKTYVTEAEYQHRRDPLITSFLEEDDGRKTAIAKAPKIFDQEALFLARPGNLSFDSDDLLVYHSKLQVKQMRRAALRKHTWMSFLNPFNWLGLYGRRVYRPIPTWRLRTELWSAWLKSGTIDAPTACWLDELILREEPLLRKYWRFRDKGRLHDAKRALDKHIDQVVSAIDIMTDVSEVCALSIKSSDLYAMGLGKDATEVTTRPQDCFRDTEDRVSVIFNDIGAWPEAPGGVSNCRRDLVNGHSTVRNHVLAECANDFGIPRFQIEKNVQSLKLLPLWGLDRKTAHHGLIDNLLQSQVDEKVRDTDVQRDIVGVFIPLLKDFVKGARTRRYSREGLIKYSNVMLSMSKYYEHKDYSRTWESKEVERAWVDAWLMPYNDPNILDPESCFELERPSMHDFREALGIYLAYFFIFSVKIPERCPRVFQSTHHGISSLFGMILRYRKGVTFGIWDHAILWRECCLNISPAQCELPISVQSMLLSGIGLASRLAYFHADVIMPCTSLFNP